MNMKQNLFKISNKNNDNDSKRIKDVVEKNRCKNINSPFSFGKNANENENNQEGQDLENPEEQNQDGQKKEKKSTSLLNNASDAVKGAIKKKVLPKSLSFLGGSKGKGKENSSKPADLVKALISLKTQKYKLMAIGGGLSILFSFCLPLVLVVASAEDHGKEHVGTVAGAYALNPLLGKIVDFGFGVVDDVSSFVDDVSSLLSSNKNNSDLPANFLNLDNEKGITATKMDNKQKKEQAKTQIPDIGNMDFDDYFDKYLKLPLIEYLAKNEHCVLKTCTESSPYEFNKRYFEVTLKFKQKGYPLDAYLMQSTMSYYRSDEDLYSGATEKEKIVGWIAWIKSLFKSKTDEISLLANKQYRKKSDEWKIDIDKYVAYLMYGKTMHDKSEDGSDEDLEIEMIGDTDATDYTKYELNTTEHKYQYGGFDLSDGDYEGYIEAGYIYHRFKDSPNFVGKKGKSLEKEIQRTIQKILDDRVKKYGNPDYLNELAYEDYDGGCSAISMTDTTLTKEEFVGLAKAYASGSKVDNCQKKGGATILANYAGQIYDMGKNNHVNPELVFVRARAEGCSPGISKNNFWGIGCVNGGGAAACHSYGSVMLGVEAFMKNISQYKTIQSMMKRYAYIGAYWYNTPVKIKDKNGKISSEIGSGTGGCYYLPYIKKFMNENRYKEVKGYCDSKSCPEAYNTTGCHKTNDADQKAYADWQVEKMAEHRKKIFKISYDKCDEINVEGANIGEKVANYAVKKFDSYSYSQTRRTQPGYVDCSSMVWFAYNHFGINIYQSQPAANTANIYDWCNKNGVMLKSNEKLLPGDLVLRYNMGAKTNHVEIYIGNNKSFGAHTDKKPQKDQVSVVNFNRDSYNYFCRPWKNKKE